MTHSRSLSEKFPSYRQEACTTENVIQCLSIRERKKERLGWREDYMRTKSKNKLEGKAQRTKGDHHKKGGKSGCINKINTTMPLSSIKCIG